MEKRGISQIITTILIILLVLAAIIIVWQAVKGTIEKGTEGMDDKIACIEIELDITKAEYTSGGTTTANNKVYVTRQARGTSNKVGVKFVIDGTIVNPTDGIPAKLGPLESAVYDFAGDTLTSSTRKIEVAAVLNQGTDNELTCDISGETAEITETS